MKWLTCFFCEWSGKSDKLVSKTERLNDHDYDFCPDCGGKKFDCVEMDEEGIAWPVKQKTVFYLEE